jgi:LysR family transcriptional regulator, low CO2-responsive transcriptional regulator
MILASPGREPQLTSREKAMTLYQFKLFLVIAKCGSLTRAALELRMSQPALTHQMKLLQESYGAALYIRTLHGIALTPAGERLLLGIEPIMDLVGKLRSDAGLAPGQARKTRQNVLRVGGTDAASIILLPNLLARFHAQHPHITLEFRTRTSDHLERMVANASMDLAVTARRPVSNELQYELLRSERIALFVATSHRLAARRQLHIDEVLTEPLIVRGGRNGGGVTDQALLQLRRRASSLKISMYCDGPTAIKAAVAQGIGVGMVFEETLKPEVAAGRFKILNIRDLHLEGESYIVYARGEPIGQWTDCFLKILRHERERLVASSAPRSAGFPLATSGVPRPAL